MNIARVLVICFFLNRIDALGAFTAFDDMGWMTGEPVSNVTTGSPAGLLTTALLDASSGTTLPATATFSGAALLNAYAITLPPGSDADAIFSGHVSCSNYAYFSGAPITLSVSGLNPSRAYTFALYSTRGTDAEKYSNRWTDVTLLSADLFTNNSSAGSMRFSSSATDDSTRIISANMDGRVVRFDGIKSGSDGAILISIAAGATNAETPTAYLEAFMLRELDYAGPLLPSSLNVNGGTILINGQLNSSNLYVGSSATAGGSGTIRGGLRVAGSLAPGPISGSPAATMYVTGTVDFLPGSHYRCDITSPTNSDRLSIQGSVTGACDVQVTQSGGGAPMLLTISDASGANTFNQFTLGGLAPSNWALAARSTSLLLSDAITDTNTNSLPNWWEMLFFGGPTAATANADPDSDGAINQEEYLAGTDPTNGQSRFEVSTVTPVASNTFWVSWPSVAGRHYSIVQTTNLAAGSFATLVTNLTATPPANSYQLTIPAGTREFYTIRVRKD